ncbi:MAG: translocated intimin receptor Tir [Acidobacteriaceae bacterium]
MKTLLRAILTDSHFWVPFVVLGVGVVLLLRLV